MKQVLFILAIIIFSGLAYPQKTDFENQIDRINETAIDAYLSGDLKTLYSFYTDDAIGMPNFRPILRGKEEMINLEKEYRDNGFKPHTMRFIREKIFTDGDYVIEIGLYNISFSLPGHEAPFADNGKFINVFEIQPDGSLKVKAEIYNTDTSFGELVKRYIQ